MLCCIVDVWRVEGDNDGRCRADAAGGFEDDRGCGVRGGGVAMGAGRGGGHEDGQDAEYHNFFSSLYLCVSVVARQV